MPRNNTKYTYCQKKKKNYIAEKVALIEKYNSWNREKSINILFNICIKHKSVERT